MKMLKDGTLTAGVPTENPPYYKTDLEKFSLVLESKSVAEEKLGEWLRHNGLHSEHLQLWEQELAEVSSAQTHPRRAPGNNRSVYQ